jgi:hypothetical protein
VALKKGFSLSLFVFSANHHSTVPYSSTTTSTARDSHYQAAHYHNRGGEDECFISDRELGWSQSGVVYFKQGYGLSPYKSTITMRILI